MIIHIKRTGGVTGIPLEKTINSETLPTQKAEEIQTIVQQSDFFSLTSETTSTNKPDRFQYTISIEHQTKKHSVTVTEETIPESLKTLIQNIMNL